MFNREDVSLDSGCLSPAVSEACRNCEVLKLPPAPCCAGWSVQWTPVLDGAAMGRRVRPPETREMQETSSAEENESEGRAD